MTYVPASHRVVELPGTRIAGCMKFEFSIPRGSVEGFESMESPGAPPAIQSTLLSSFTNTKYVM